jgi:hypothetical protein
MKKSLVALLMGMVLSGCAHESRHIKGTDGSISAAIFFENYKMSIPTLRPGERWTSLSIVPSFHAEKGMLVIDRHGGYEVGIAEYERRYDSETKSRGSLSRWELWFPKLGMDEHMEVLFRDLFLPVTANYDIPMMMDGITFWVVSCEYGGQVEIYNGQNPDWMVPRHWSKAQLYRSGYIQIGDEVPRAMQLRMLAKRWQQVVSAWHDLYWDAKRSTGRATLPDPSEWDQYWSPKARDLVMPEYEVVPETQ